LCSVSEFERLLKETGKLWKTWDRAVCHQAENWLEPTRCKAWVLPSELQCLLVEVCKYYIKKWEQIMMTVIPQVLFFVSCWPVTTKALIQSQTSLRFIGGRVALGHISVRLLQFSSVIIIPPLLHTHAFICHLYYIILVYDSIVK
jgi:hypothetical protein